MEGETGGCVIFQYLDQFDVSKDFFICIRTKKGIVLREYRLPETFTEDIRERGIHTSSVSTYNALFYDPEEKKEEVKKYCENHGMNFIEIQYPTMAAENHVVRDHMERLYGMEIDFDPLADFRRFKSILKLFP